MMGMQGYAQGMVMFNGLVLIAIIMLIAVARSLTSIFSERTGRGVRAMNILRVSIRRVVIAVVLGFIANYALDVRLRSHTGSCRSEHSDIEGQPYTATYCLLWNDNVLLRLYDTNTEKLLAERTYYYLDFPKLTWTKDSLIYDTSSENGEIRFPPTLIDRLRAKFP
jgi:hypothetical protein